MYQSLDVPIDQREKEVSTRNGKKFFAVLLAGIAALSLVGFATYKQQNEEFAPAAPVSRAEVQAFAGGCQVYAGGRLVKNTKVFDTEYNKQMSVEFKFKINAGSSFGNIIQIGGHGDDEFPAIFFHSSGSSDKVTVQFEKQGNSRYWAKDLNNIQEGQEYHLLLEINDMKGKLTLDGTVVHDSFDIPAEFEPNAGLMPVYASGDWNNAANGEISNLRVCSGPPCKTQASFAGGSLVKNRKVGDVGVGDDLDVEFKFKIDTGSAFGNIVQIGAGGGDDEWPAIFFHSSGSNDKVTVQFEREGNSKYWAKDLTGIQENQEYSLRIEIRNQEDCQIWLDGVKKHDFKIPAEFKPQKGSYPVYASGNWNNAAKGSISDLLVCQPSSGGGSPPPAPSGNCKTANNEVALARNKLLFRTDITNDFDVYFKVKLTGRTGAILQIGNYGDEEVPLVMLWSGNRFSFQFEKYRSRTETRHTRSGVSFNRWYDIKVEFRGLRVTISVDGAAQSVNLRSTDKVIASNRGVYACGPWNSAAAGSIKDVKVCTH